MSAGVEIEGVDWSTVFQIIGTDPSQAIKGQSQLAVAMALSDEVSVDDETRAAELIAPAIENDGLAHVEEGYVIEEYYDGRDGDENTSQSGSSDEQSERKADGVDEELREELKRLRAKVRGQDEIITLLLGDMSFSEIETAEMRAMLPRIQSLEDRLLELEKEAQQRAQVSERTVSKPDERAQRVRQALVEHSDDDGSEVALTRDKVNVILGGIHRGTVIDAMKRAADGRLACEDDRTYSPTPGTSDLEPVDAIRFEVGQAREKQSRVVLETDRLTGSDFRQNLMTREER